MTPTIDQIEAALPYVPAGIHCGDLTEPDERREFAEVIHGIVVAAMRCELCGDQRILNFGDCPPCPACSETAPESRQDAATDPSAPAPQNDPPTLYGRNNGVAGWPPPKPGTHESDLSVLKAGWPGMKMYQDAKRWSQKNAQPPTPTDMSIAWGITEALIEDRGR